MTLQSSYKFCFKPGPHGYCAVRSPGKFERQSPLTILLYQLSVEGWYDEMVEGGLLFVLDEEIGERLLEEFPMLKDEVTTSPAKILEWLGYKVGERVVLVEDDQGFVSLEEYRGDLIQVEVHECHFDFCSERLYLEEGRDIYLEEDVDYRVISGPDRDDMVTIEFVAPVECPYLEWEEEGEVCTYGGGHYRLWEEDVPAEVICRHCQTYGAMVAELPF